MWQCFGVKYNDNGISFITYRLGNVDKCLIKVIGGRVFLYYTEKIRIIEFVNEKLVKKINYEITNKQHGLPYVT